MDNISTQKRSEIMSRVKSGNSKAEIIVRSKLNNLGYRFKLHDSNHIGG